MDDSPLTDDERARAARLAVWSIWYDDAFSGDGFPLSVCLSEEEARADLERRVASGSSKRFQPGWDGIAVVGPRPLDENLYGAAIVREVMRRAAAGEPGPVPVPIT